MTHPDNIEVMIDSLLTVVHHDMREAAEKDLRALVEMARTPEPEVAAPRDEILEEACDAVKGLTDHKVGIWGWQRAVLNAIRELKSREPQSNEEKS